MKTSVALALVLGSALGAQAGTVLVTPPLQVPVGDYLICLASNLDEKPRSLVVEILRPGGLVVASSLVTVVSAGGVNGASTNDVFASYCRITFEGSKKRVRGQMTLSTLGTIGTPPVPLVSVVAQP